MISVLKDRDGFVFAYAEWQILDEKGQFKNFGDYIYIQNIWVHGAFRRMTYLKYLAHEIYVHPYSKASRFVYWKVARDEDRKKILENEERPFTQTEVSPFYEKEKIYKKIIGDKNVQKTFSMSL